MLHQDINQPKDHSTRFGSLWSRQQSNLADGSQVVYEKLLDAYNEPHRVYHNLTHITSCLKIFDQISELLDDPDAVELAIWFHDVIYKVKDGSDNEQRSANLFMTLTESLFNNEFRNTVYEHIMATRHNCSSITNSDTKLMVDIDLSSFGLPWAKFLNDNRNVRAEMCHIPDDDYNQKQMSFQRSLLSQPSFFKSDYFHEHYEAQAHRNIAKLFELIKNGDAPS